MEIFHWKEYWSLLKTSLRKAYPELSEEDLEYHEGAGSHLITRLGSKLHRSSVELNELLFVHLLSLEEEAEQDAYETGMDPEKLLEELEKEMGEA